MSRPIASFTAWARGLFGAEIPLRGLDRGVTEQQLDLLQLSAGLSAELCARKGSPQEREIYVR